MIQRLHHDERAIGTIRSVLMIYDTFLKYFEHQKFQQMSRQL